MLLKINPNEEFPWFRSFKVFRNPSLYESLEGMVTMGVYDGHYIGLGRQKGISSNLIRVAFYLEGLSYLIYQN